MKCVSIATEDVLSEGIVAKIIHQYSNGYFVYNKFRRDGFGYLKTNIKKFNEIANNIHPVVLLTDLDTNSCAPNLIKNWTGNLNISDKLLIRVAIREAESWLLADRPGFSRFVGIAISKTTQNPEALSDPKSLLLQLVKTSKNRNLKADLLPEKGSPSKVGINYNNSLISYVDQYWDPERARALAPSLDRAIARIQSLP